MKIDEIIKIVDAEVLTQDVDTNVDIAGAFASDMMSDVLAFAKNQDILITGLCNPQTIRTAVMLDMKCILLVRGKTPTQDMILLARQNQMVILGTKLKLYEVCGRLYKAGLPAGD